MAKRDESNVLAPHKPYDYKIELFERKEKALRYSLLYKISIFKLKLTKAYFIDNLNKDKHGYDNVFIVIDRFFKQAISILYHKSIDAKSFAKLYIYYIYNFKLKLPESIKVHLIFHLGRLRKALNNLTLEQIILELNPINITNELKYEVKNILAYLAFDFMYAPFKVRDFHLKHKELPGLLAKLFDWIKAYSNGVNDYDHLSSDKAIDKRSRTSFFQTRK
ncbi:hypothetical protein MBM_09635 [Drepanopeziza brunnea f. sp. 'multigermtubi' MB_m1]|uniref:Uncharacterized protein n=1 Tax=Marssonina brunnea f. sp. multigermtubi (strain MB_m1) TaxID=1072389 RepID=K1W5N5_MARBU|nr:uncharacterized protein MBM_09635 [Drepanopeziza brunnea f. sp. 'multigermtubi' MB_m1]EKD12200.1 hypothetical protein MBM_09635 [Drepanopeziza brunnea f. sp. 'multigermtubi' MB_m1]